MYACRHRMCICKSTYQLRSMPDGVDQPANRTLGFSLHASHASDLRFQSARLAMRAGNAFLIQWSRKRELSTEGHAVREACTCELDYATSPLRSACHHPHSPKSLHPGPSGPALDDANKHVPAKQTKTRPTIQDLRKFKTCNPCPERLSHASFAPTIAACTGAPSDAAARGSDLSGDHAHPHPPPKSDLSGDHPQSCYPATNSHPHPHPEKFYTLDPVCRH